MIMEKPGLVFVMIFISRVCAQSINRNKTCGPSDDLRVTLTCPAGNWINIDSKRYSTAPSNDSNCTLTDDCLRSPSSHSSGLDALCNGPVGATGTCEEKSDIRESFGSCSLGSSRAFIEVRYSCIPGGDVMNMCSNETRSWTPIIEGFEVRKAYLATPFFPNTPALSQLCSCTITGKNIWMRGLEIHLDAGGVDMLTVSVDGTVMWGTGQTTGQLHYLQEALLSAGGNISHSQARVTFRDYNMPYQIAWIEIRDIRGENLTISCQVFNVAPPPTTTVMTRTTEAPPSTTTATPSIASTVRTTWNPAPASITTGTQTMVKPTTTTSKDRSASDRVTLVKKGENAGLIVGLVIVAVVLVLVAVILGIIVRRRLQTIKKGEHQPHVDGSGRGPFLGLQCWYHNRRHNHDNVQAAGDNIHYPAPDFHNMEECAAPPPEPSQVSGIERGGNAETSEGFGAPFPSHWSGNVSTTGSSYETVGELDLRLKTVPTENVVASSPDAVTGYSELSSPDIVNYHKIYDVVDYKRDVSSAEKGESVRGFVNTSSHDNQRFNCTDSGGDSTDMKRSPLNSQVANSTPPEEKNVARTKDQLRKERFVAKVLDETLESIKQQRKTLADTPELMTNGIPQAPIASLPAESGPTV